MTVSRLRRVVLAVGVALGVSFGGMVAVAAPASAVLFTCNTTPSQFEMPYYVNGNYSSLCLQNESYYYYSPTLALQRSYNYCYASYFGNFPSVTTNRLKEDGKYGPLTTVGIARVQGRERIDQDGLFGPVTGVNMAFKAKANSGYPAGCYRFDGYATFRKR